MSLDPIALAFNDYQAKLVALEAKQVKEEELVAARRYADNVIKSMFDILIVTDADMEIQTANQAACDLLRIRRTRNSSAVRSNPYSGKSLHFWACRSAKC